MREVVHLFVLRRRSRRCRAGQLVGQLEEQWVARRDAADPSYKRPKVGNISEVGGGRAAARATDEAAWQRDEQRLEIVQPQLRENRAEQSAVHWHLHGIPGVLKQLPPPAVAQQAALDAP